jgi:hypothetical protein
LVFGTGRTPRAPEAAPDAATDAAPGVPVARTGADGPSAIHDVPPILSRMRSLPYIGDRPPAYEAEPTALPGSSDLQPGVDLAMIGPDTVLDGARYGPLTVRAASVRGDSPRFRGDPRRDALLLTRLGTGDDAMLLLAVAGGVRNSAVSFLAARDACATLTAELDRNRAAILADLRRLSRDTPPDDGDGDHGDHGHGNSGSDPHHSPLQVAAGLQRLAARVALDLRRHAAHREVEPADYATTVRCLLVPVDPACRSRIFFGVGTGAVYRLRDGAWENLEPPVRGPAPPPPGKPPVPDPRSGGYAAAAAHAQLRAEPAPDPEAAGPSVPGGVLPADPGAFRFHALTGRPGDVLLIGSPGTAGPLGEPGVATYLAERWGPETLRAQEESGPPGLADFLRQVQVRVKGHADDRTLAVLWDSGAPRDGGAQSERGAE